MPFDSYDFGEALPAILIGDTELLPPRCYLSKEGIKIMSDILTVWRFWVNNSADEFLEIPVSLRLQLIYFLKLNESIGVDKLGKVHETTSNSYHEFHIHDLGVNLSGTEKIESSSKSPDRYTDLHWIYVFGKELIDLIPLMSLVKGACSDLFGSVFVVQLWCLLSKRLFKTFNNDLFVS